MLDTFSFGVSSNWSQQKSPAAKIIGIYFLGTIVLIKYRTISSTDNQKQISIFYQNSWWSGFLFSDFNFFWPVYFMKFLWGPRLKYTYHQLNQFTRNNFRLSAVFANTSGSSLINGDIWVIFQTFQLQWKFANFSQKSPWKVFLENWLT